MATANPQNTVQLRRVLDAPREHVFRAWSDLEQIRKWWGPGGFTLPEAEQDFRVGGAYRFAMLGPDGLKRWLKGCYREIKPPERLVFTWTWEADAERVETVVTIEFIARGAQTELVLTHGPFPTETGKQLHEGGWSSQLDRLPGIL